MRYGLPQENPSAGSHPFGGSIFVPDLPFWEGPILVKRDLPGFRAVFPELAAPVQRPN